MGGNYKGGLRVKRGGKGEIPRTVPETREEKRMEHERIQGN